MNALPTAAFVLLAIGALVQGAFIVAGKDLDPVSGWASALASLALAVDFAAKSIGIGFPAFTGVLESLTFFSACVAALGLAYTLQRRLPVLAPARFGLYVAALALLAVASSPAGPASALPPVPALRSGWLALHVSFTLIGESLFALSFVASLCVLSPKGRNRAEYDRLAYASVAVGYPVFTAGALVFGAIWAEQAWGAWWSWDPKETWALVTWLAYTLYLHQRLVKRRSGRGAAAIAVAAFLCALFTFFGVNYLLSGLHSYA
jgi:ABC-type transport system involved in cytochrome c biogenesis permease subunit